MTTFRWPHFQYDKRWPLKYAPHTVTHMLHFPKETMARQITIWSATCAALVMMVGCAAPPTVPTIQAVLTCSMQRAGAQYVGSCDVPCRVNELAVNIDGVDAKAACSAPPRKVTASLRQVESAQKWLGEMQGRQVEDPMRFELLNATANSRGVAKTPYGWFAVQSAQIDAEKMLLAVSVDRQLPPSQDDLRIIRRAIQLIPNTQAWNKNDNRVCPKGAEKISVFCALTQATEEVSGGVHYRQPALQAVREVVNEVGGTRVDKHRLMDYNNHPDTTLDDIYRLLNLAQTRLEKRLANR